MLPFSQRLIFFWCTKLLFSGISRNSSEFHDFLLLLNIPKVFLVLNAFFLLEADSMSLQDIPFLAGLEHKILPPVFCKLNIWVSSWCVILDPTCPVDPVKLLSCRRAWCMITPYYSTFWKLLAIYFHPYQQVSLMFGWCLGEELSSVSNFNLS